MSKLGHQGRHQSLWLEDGNVVLCIEDVLFKVHRSILSRLSPSFLSHFTHWHDYKLFDGHPLIQLEIGLATSGDFEALLLHLYHDKPLRPNSPFEQTARILRACVQFDFPAVRKLALDRLGTLYPRRPAPFECLNWEYLPEAAQLALDCGASDILPALMYAIVTTVDFDVEESSNEHRLAAVPSENPKSVAPPIRSDIHRLCIQLMNRIMDHFSPLLFTVPTSSHMKCTSVFADHWMNFAIQPALDDSGVYKPLETLKGIQGIDWSFLGLCDACCEEKREEWENEADDIWSRVIGWVDLDCTNYVIKVAT